MIAWIFISILLYFAVGVYQWQMLRQQDVSQRWLGLLLAGLAILAQGWLLHHWIDLAGGQNLDIFNMISLVLWMAALLLWLLTLFQPLGPMWLLIAPLVIVSIILRAVFPGYYMTDTRAEPEVLAHILLTVLLVGVFCVAGLQAMVLRMQQSMLKSKKECVWFNRLPAIETMERVLFQLLWIGFALLSIVLISSIYSYGNLLFSNPAVLHKAIIVVLTWLVFFITLVGRYALGWRGKRAAIGTLICMLVLLVVYLSSRLLY